MADFDPNAPFDTPTFDPAQPFDVGTRETGAVIPPEPAAGAGPEQASMMATGSFAGRIASAGSMGVPLLLADKAIRGALNQANERAYLRKQGITDTAGAPAEVQRNLQRSAYGGANAIKQVLTEYYQQPVEVGQLPNSNIYIYRDPSAGGVQKPVDLPGFVDMDSFGADLGGISGDMFEASMDYIGSIFAPEILGAAAGVSSADALGFGVMGKITAGVTGAVAGTGSRAITGPTTTLATAAAGSAFTSSLARYAQLRAGQRQGLNLEFSNEELMSIAMQQAGVPSLFGSVVGSALGLAVFGRAQSVGEGQFTPISDAAAQAAERLGLPPLHIGQLSDNPLIRRLYGYSQQFSRDTQLMTEKQRVELRTRLKAEADQGDVGMTELVQYLEAEERQIMRHIVGFRSVPREQAFSALSKEINENYIPWLEQAARQQFDELRAHPEAAAATFNVEPLISRLRELRRGTPSQSKPDPVTGMRGEVALGPSPLLHPDMQRMLGHLDQLDPLLTAETALAIDHGAPRTIYALDKLRALRRDVFDLRDHNDPAVRRASTDIWQMTKRIMAEPQNVSRDYADRIVGANEFYSAMETTKGIDYIAEAIKQGETPEKFAAKYFSPGEFDQALTMLKLSVSPQAWETYRMGFITNITERARMSGGDGGQEMLNFLNQYATHPSALRAFVSEQEEFALRQWGQEYSRFLNSPKKQMVDKWLADGHIFREQAKVDPKAFMGELARTGGVEGPIASKARSSLYLEILSTAERNSKEFTETGVDSGVLADTIRKAQTEAKTSGANTFMRPEDWRVLEDMRLYAIGNSRTPTGGASIAASSQVGSMFSPRKAFGALTYFHYRAHAATAAVLSLPYSRGQVLMPFVNMPRQMAAWGAALNSFGDTPVGAIGSPFAGE